MFKVKEFFEAWELLGDAALAGTIGGCLLGFLGVYILFSRMVFLTAALTQVSSFSIALSFFLKGLIFSSAFLLSPSFVSAIVTFAFLFYLIKRRRKDKDSRDAILGIVFASGWAGTLVIGNHIIEEIHDINTLLLGTAVAVLPEDLNLLAFSLLFVAFIHFFLWRGFSEIILDPEGAAVRKIEVGFLQMILFATIAFSISISTGILGALPTFAYSVVPAIGAIRLASNIGQALILAALIGAFSGFFGYIVSFTFELPVGAAQALTAATLVFVILIPGSLFRR